MEEWKDLVCIGVAGYLGICTALPLTVFWYYRNAKHEIGRSVGWMAFGEFAGMLGTSIFAVFEYANMFSIIDWRWSSCIRLVMGTVAAATTLHLARATYHCIIDYENNRDAR